MMELRMTRNLSLLAALAILASGCARVRLADSVDLTFDWSVVPSDELHTPYVAGADFSLYTLGVDEEDQVGWRLASGDSSVLRIDSTANGDAEVTATGAGVATVSVLDADGGTVHRAPLEVRRADRAELFAHGGLILGRPELQEDWDEIRILAGGSATFEVRWLDGDERLFGHGALSATAEGDITVRPRRTYLFEDREWVTFTPHAPGTYEVELAANGVPVRTVRVVAVTEDAVARVRLHGMDESGAREGETLTVLAQAYDAEERPIFGVEYAWELDGALQEGAGDLYRYTFAPGAVRSLCARFDRLEAEVSIQAREGFVDSTNRLGCAAAGAGRPSGAPLAPALVLAVAMVARRRSPRRGR
jgi:hypothetical protein